ncbi:hypothetical protein [Lentzea flaviverrucosa]|nr:hypothetical protein [Lentzea flaviverrucosa]
MADDVMSSASTEPEEKSMVVDRSRSVTISDPAVPLPPADAPAEES